MSGPAQFDGPNSPSSSCSWEVVDSGSASDQQETEDEIVCGDHSNPKLNSVEAQAEMAVENALGAGASDGVAAGGDVYHYHQHFLRKHRYIMNDRSVHYHINHVHHHHYHLHGEFPFRGYNGFNGNGNVASLRLDLCARDRGHDRSRSRALASETERLTGYPFCVFMWLHKQTSIHLLVMFQDMRNRCHGANSVTVTMTV